MFDGADSLLLDRQSYLSANLASQTEPSQDLSRTMVDLFAGCGGLSLGFEQAGLALC
jgi:hypothetical protein